MKLLNTLATFCLLFLAFGVQAQDSKAEQILNKATTQAKEYKTITADFTFSLDDNIADLHQTQEGKIIIKGDKFLLELGDNTIYSNGTTQWTYNKDMNEVYIDAAGGAQGNLRPDKLFTMWETGFKKYYGEEGTLNGTPVHILKLNPTDPSDKNYHTIKVFVGKNDHQVKQAIIQGKQGQNYTYTIKSFTPNKEYSEATFTFDKSKHPGVEVIDNR